MDWLAIAPGGLVVITGGEPLLTPTCRLPNTGLLHPTDAFDSTQSVDRESTMTMVVRDLDANTYRLPGGLVRAGDAIKDILRAQVDAQAPVTGNRRGRAMTVPTLTARRRCGR